VSVSGVDSTAPDLDVDRMRTNRHSECKPIDYPAPDGKLSFDILTSVSMTGTNHAENQPVHLRLPSAPGSKAKHTAKNVGGGFGIGVCGCG
jgi:electron-transferring-flavoprotein dehydrogenase